MIDGDFDTTNGLELAHTPQTLASIFFDGTNVMFYDANNHTIDPSGNSEMLNIATVDGGLMIGDANVEVSVSNGSLALFNEGSIAGMLNDGDAWSNGAISVDAIEGGALNVDELNRAVDLGVSPTADNVTIEAADTALLHVFGNVSSVNGAALTDIDGNPLNGSELDLWSTVEGGVAYDKQLDDARRDGGSD